MQSYFDRDQCQMKYWVNCFNETHWLPIFVREGYTSGFQLYYDRNEIVYYDMTNIYIYVCIYTQMYMPVQMPYHLVT